MHTRRIIAFNHGALGAKTALAFKEEFGASTATLTRLGPALGGGGGGGSSIAAMLKRAPPPPGFMVTLQQQQPGGEGGAAPAAKRQKGADGAANAAAVGVTGGLQIEHFFGGPR